MSERAEKNLLYGNWEVQAPDGTILFLALQERADWYLSRGLADVVGDNKIRLNFEPKGKRDPNDLYSICAKSNNCVVCNDSDITVLTKHHIVPSEYRKFFPVEIKSRSCHDIVPICRKHHDDYEAEADKFKQKIAEDYDVEFNHKKFDDDVVTALRLAKVLLIHPCTVPVNRLEQIRTDFVKYSGIVNITDETVSEFILEHKNHKSKTHGEQVVEKVIKEGKLYEFVVMWRKHFVDTMNPQYLPKYWDITRKLIIK
jgi:hypothetical protein